MIAFVKQFFGLFSFFRKVFKFSFSTLVDNSAYNNKNINTKASLMMMILMILKVIINTVVPPTS